MPTTDNTPHTFEALLRVVQVRDAEVLFIELMLELLTPQLLRPPSPARALRRMAA